MTHRDNDRIYLEDVYVGVSVTTCGADRSLKFQSKDDRFETDKYLVVSGRGGLFQCRKKKVKPQC